MRDDANGQMPTDVAEPRRWRRCARSRRRPAGTDTEHAVYEEGFTGADPVGALFVAFVMMPGAIYLGLVSGQGLGSASEWVTIVLFAEVARRSFMPLKRQEIYIIFYIAAALSHLNATLGVVGGPFGDRIWDGFLHTANQAVGTKVDVWNYLHFRPAPRGALDPQHLNPGWVHTTVSRAIPAWASRRRRRRSGRSGPSSTATG